jgi:DNA-binding transcriptional MerR regulator/DNA-directed RNA polymerase subunit RPC12/RpoP
MPEYTTGEIAKLCHVSVRTVQYYDNREILCPSQLSEGGRRLYTDKDVQKLQLICFLRDLGISIKSIKELFEQENSSEVVALLLQQQEKTLQQEIEQNRKRLKTIKDLNKVLGGRSDYSLENFKGIQFAMNTKEEMKKIYTKLLLSGILVGIPLKIALYASLFFAVWKGVWLPFLLFFLISCLFAAAVSIWYFRKVDYLCPECSSVFVPARKEAVFARHTTTMRKVTCPYCGYKGFCLEIPAQKHSDAKEASL